MDSFNISTNKSFHFSFPTVLEHSFAQTSAKYQLERGHYFSTNNIFISNGDTFNGKYIVQYLKKNSNEFIGTSSINLPNNLLLNELCKQTMEGQKIFNQPQDLVLVENANIMSNIGFLTKKQYNVFLDQPSSSKKISYLKNLCSNQLSMFYKPGLMPLQRPLIKNLQAYRNGFGFKIFVTLVDEQLNKSQCHLENCEIVDKSDILFGSKLMQCGVVVFDITSDSESDLQHAIVTYNYIYNELIKYTDEKILMSKKNGIVRKFILISSIMTFVKDTNNHPVYMEDEEAHIGVTPFNVLERMPLSKYQTVFEFEKLILKSNHSKIKDIFKTYVISTGITYGHEEYTFSHIFTNAWRNPEEMYILPINRAVPVFHVDELATLIFIVSKHDGHVTSNYILAVEQETYGFNDIIKSVCGEFCDSNLVFKDNYSVINHYKFNDSTWDVVNSNLTIDPMLDVTVPDYQTKHPSIITTMNKLASDFVEANNLHPKKFVISGQPTHVVASVSKHLACCYRLKHITTSDITDNYLKSIEKNLNQLKSQLNYLNEKRSRVVRLLNEPSDMAEDEPANDVNPKVTAYEHTSDEVIDGSDRDFETFDVPKNYISTNLPKFNNFKYGLNLKENTDEVYETNILIEIDIEVNNVKHAMEKEYNKYVECTNNINKNKGQFDNHYLWPLIKESLSSFSCRNQGYVLEIFPLSVEQMELIFDDNIGYPNFMILLLNIPRTLDSSCMKIKDRSNGEFNNSQQNVRTNFNHQKLHNTGHFNLVDAMNKTNIYDVAKNEVDTTIIHNKHGYEVATENYVINYLKNKIISLLKFNVPFELDDKKISYNLKYKSFLNTILTQIGHPPAFTDNDVKEDSKNIISTVEIDKTKFTNKKLKIVLNKLNIMKEQWHNDSIKCLELEKNQRSRNSIKICNFLSTNILPKLLKEMSPIAENNSILEFPENVLIK